METQPGMKELRPLAFSLYSAKLYGTELMTLRVAAGLRNWFGRVIIYAPRGPMTLEARKLGLEVIEIGSLQDAVSHFFSLLRQNESLSFVSTRTAHSLIVTMLNLVFRRRLVHLQIIHGNGDERSGYGTKARLNWLPVEFLAVSDFVRDRLIANGVRAGSIHVIENFLSTNEVTSSAKRSPYHGAPVRKVALVSRLVPAKQLRKV